jgi:hypothetical protein
LIREGVSDLHCMSDEYLVDELEEEYLKDFKKQPGQTAFYENSYI